MLQEIVKGMTIDSSACGWVRKGMVVVGGWDGFDKGILALRADL